MNANDFYSLKVKKAKSFGFPEPIFLNVEKLTDLTRVVYLVEIQAVHVPGRDRKKTHHYYLKFSKFKKIAEEPYWVEENITTQKGFAITDRSSIEKLAGYIKMNQALLDIDILSKDYTSAILSSDAVATDIVREILASEKNKEVIYELFKEKYPEFDKKILAYKLAQTRRKSLDEFKESLGDAKKNEQNYWQRFLEKNRWMFGISYFALLDDTRIDLWNTADYLFESEDGFVDIVEIKSPHFDFWQRDRSGTYKKYRGFLQPDEELKGSITQATNYIFQLEKKFSDPDWGEQNGVEAPVKPSCTIIFGRSKGWKKTEKTAYRLLNDSLHGIDILTFDYLYSRAERLLEVLERES